MKWCDRLLVFVSTILFSCVLYASAPSDSLRRFDFEILYSPDSPVNQGVVGDTAHTRAGYGAGFPFIREWNRDSLMQYSVGRIPMNETVSPTGGHVIQVPIEAVPIRGIDPGISLVYNSQGDIGLAGYGWTVGGLSSITLAGKNMHYDGETEPVHLHTSSQKYYLDGVRLVENPDASQASWADYETATGYVKVFRRHSASVKMFDAFYPDGSRAVFGLSTETAPVPSLPVTSKTDIKGNRVQYEYTKDNNLYYITRIRYGATSTTPAIGEMRFYYTDIEHPVVKYIDGIAISQALMLNRIESWYDGNKIREYSLIHADIAGSPVLTEIRCRNGSDEELPPVQFAYEGPDTDTFGVSSLDNGKLYSGSNNESLAFIRGKMLPGSYNDGLIIYPQLPVYGVKDGLYQYIYPSDQDILIVPQFIWPRPSTIKIIAGKGFQTMQACDVDGDGVDEAVKVNITSIGSSSITVKLTIYRLSPAGTLETPETHTFTMDGVHEGHGKLRSWFFGDFLGNGKTQLLTIKHNIYQTSIQSVSLIDIETGSILSNQTNLEMNWNEDSFYSCLDYDGDGKTDLWLDPSNQLKIYTYNEDESQFEMSYLIGSVSGEHLRTSIFGDFNADGLIDIVSTPEESKYTAYYGMMEVWAPAECPICEYPYPVRELYSEYCSSCDGNVKDWYHQNHVDYRCRVCNTLLDADMSCPVHGTMQSVSLSQTIGVDGGKKWRFMTNTGAGFNQSVRYLGRIFKGDKSMLLDVDGDNLSDLVRLKGGVLYFHKNGFGSIGLSPDDSLSIGGDSYIIAANISRPYGASGLFYLQDRTLYSVKVDPNLRMARLLTRSQDSFGNQHRVYYDLLSESSYAYDSTYDAEYPFYQAKLPLPMVSSMTEHASGDMVGHHQYSFKAPIINRAGLGFRGFVRIDDRDVLRNEVSYTIMDPVSGCPTANTTPTTQINMTWTKVTGRGLTENYVNTSLASENQLTGITVTSEKTYDIYGNMTRDLSVSYPGALTVLTETSYKKNLTGDMYFTDKPERISVTKTRDGESTASVHWMAYTNGLLTYDLETYKYGETTVNVSTKNWTYDSFGNLVTESLKPYNVTTPLTKTYVYDSVGEKMLSSTDAMGFTTTWSSFNEYGQPLQETDHKGRTTAYSYDSWGRHTGTTKPDGTSSIDSFSWSGVGLYGKSNVTTGNPESQVHYDALGRKVRAGNKRFDGQWQWSDVQYDHLGRVARESLPYRGQTASLWTLYTYDSHDRPIRILSPNGNEETWSYAGMTTHHTKNGIWSETTVDALGNVISVADTAGMVTFSLRADAQPKSVTAPGNVTTTFEYDNYGRKKAIIDPSAGTRRDSIVYATNGGYTVYHSTPNGDVNYYYDRYDRLTHVNRVGEYHTFYTYNADGLLTNVSNTNSNSENYTYDPFDRITQKTESAPGRILTIDYTYRPDGNLASATYSSSSAGVMTTEYYSYANGWNTKITLPDSTTVWEVTGENDLGQIVSGSTGSVTRSYGYDVYGMPTFRRMNGGTLQDENYSFDSGTGNLMSRSQGLSPTEYFGYDSMNRLVSEGTNHNTYDTKGNMTVKGGLGSMTYNSLHPYQATNVTLSDGVNVRQEIQTVTYTGFDRPQTIAQGDIQATFTYNASDERCRMVLRRENVDSLTRYYLGGRYESDVFVGKTVEKLYLGGDYYSAPMLLVKDGNSGWTLYNIGRDYLGSVTCVATADGTQVASYSYDAWGRLRDPATLTVYADGAEPELFTGRGYTGHEHLRDFGLINMNARLYDPLYGRFLSPDPYIQDPFSSQNYNRYSYALNNPLKYTDESGEFFLTWKITSKGIRIGVNFGFWGFGISYSWKEKRAGAYVEAGFNAGGTINGVGLNASFVTTLSVEFDKDFNYSFVSISAAAEVTIGVLKVSNTVAYSVTRDFEKQNEGRQDWINHTIQYVASISLPYEDYSGGVSYDYQKNFDTGDYTHKLNANLGYKDTNNGINIGAKGGLTWNNGHKSVLEGSFSLSQHGSAQLSSKTDKKGTSPDYSSLLRPMTPINSSNFGFVDVLDICRSNDDQLVQWWLKSKK